MTDQVEKFLSKLETLLGNHPEKNKIMEDYRLHVEELLYEELIDPEEIYDELTQRMGSPREIARQWRQETVTPARMQLLFVLLNIGMFVGGIALTIIYNYFDWGWAEALWTRITAVPFIIMAGYIMFWGLLGYEIGKEFGAGGRKLLRRTFFISILPNLVFMYLVLFKIVPYEWFDPLLSFPFIILCIVFTGFLYPVCLAGFRWGKRASV
ncbi:HAAS signaling domain-containing protein [Lentibacillus salicampi]|uniref:DUF1700 domain-containing protein n=1 Tax=Lentibacillus salicampi TaxID=175306 RepID=A0A4Y9ABK7_9BACI|nr:hypothetical protein [Lentibacillus salicampi]TFJ91731.1 hypothetical protein E4U82_16195 [Lentibacillus salicampi]